MTKYQECSRCNTRRAIQVDGAHQPIDVEWVANSEDEWGE